MCTIYLVRHGQTQENLAHIFQGHLPGHLTEEGRQQAVALGEKLKGIAFDRIISSDLKRVIDTVSLAMPGSKLPWEKTAEIREIDWGSVTGLKINEVNLSCLPADVESKEALYERAGQLVERLKRNYLNETLLVVAHGLINRSIQAHIDNVPLTDIKSIPIQTNGEIRILHITN